MSEPKTRGWYQGGAGTRHVAIPLGNRKRMSRALVACETDEQADRRAEVVREVARLVIASGNGASLARWVETACEGDDANALAVLGYARQLAAGKVSTKAATSPAGKTFSQVATMWTSGELARLYPDHVAAKRTADLDVSRLDVLAKVVGDVPVARFTVDDAERAMRSLPAGLRPATRRQYAQALRRVLELAAYPLRLIPANPLPRLFLPKARNDLALQVLFPDEEAKLMACAAVPLAYRMTYGFLARMGFRKSEVIGDPETDAEPLRWRDFDLARGVVRVARSKTEKPRPVPLDAGVCAALAAWKRQLDAKEGAIVFPVNLARAETFRRHLLAAGVDRAELHARTKDSLPIRAHDLRATFCTTALATGKPDHWIRDRTGHKTITMLDRYRRAARTFAELNAGPLANMLNAVAGLSVDSASIEPEEEEEEPMRKSSEVHGKGLEPSRLAAAEPKGAEASQFDTEGPVSSTNPRDHTHLHPAEVGPIDAPIDAVGASCTEALDPLALAFLDALRPVLASAIAAELERRRG